MIDPWRAEIKENYGEMTIAQPFREGHGCATRLWLDLMLKRDIKPVVDWNWVDQDEYLSAMQRAGLT